MKQPETKSRATRTPLSDRGLSVLLMISVIVGSVTMVSGQSPFRSNLGQFASHAVETSLGARVAAESCDPAGQYDVTFNVAFDLVNLNGLIGLGKKTVGLTIAQSGGQTMISGSDPGIIPSLGFTSGVCPFGAAGIGLVGIVPFSVTWNVNVTNSGNSKGITGTYFLLSLGIELPVLYNFTGTSSSSSGPGTNADFAFSATPNDPINIYTGEKFSSEPADINLGGPMPLFLSRYYASGLKRDGLIASSLGDNWMHNFDLKLIPGTNSITIAYYGGRAIRFQKTGATWTLTGTTDIPFQLVENPAKGQSSIFILSDPTTNLLYTFEGAGKLVKIEDGKGNSHTLNYIGNSLSSISDGLGRTLSLTYDGAGHLVQVSDGTRNVRFAYTGNNLTSYTDSLSNVTTYSYDTTHSVVGLLTAKTFVEGNAPFTQTYAPDGKVATQTDANGNKYTFTYAGPSTTVTDPLGKTQRYAHSAKGELVSETDENSQSFTLGSDSNGRRISITDRLGDTTSFPYDSASGKPASITNADGTKTSFRYTARNVGGITFFDLTGVTYPDSTTESFNYDASGNLISRTDRAGNTWTYSYNSHGQVLTATNPAGAVTTLAYNPDDTPASVKDPAGNPTNFAYDALKRLILVTHPDNTSGVYTYDNDDRVLTVKDERGNTTTFTYSKNGNISTFTDALGKTTNLAYDKLDRLIRVTDPLGKSTSRTFDELGRTKTLTDRNVNVTTLGYDARSRLTSVTDPAGNVSTSTYDAESIITSITDPLMNTGHFDSVKMGRITQSTSPLSNMVNVRYDSMGRVTDVQDPLRNTTTRSYDPRGLLSGIVLPGGAITASYTRNQLGEITRITDPNGNGWTDAYDPQGRLTSSIDPLAKARTYSYDIRNRISRVVLPGGSGALELTHDGTGNITRRLYSDGTDLNYTYNAVDRLTAANGMALTYDANGRVIGSNGLTVSRDDGGRIASITLASGKTVTYSYDSRSLITQVKDWLGGTTTFTYDAAGRLTSMTRPNGVTTTYTYDNDDRLIGIQEGSLSSISLTRDAKGQVTAATRNVPLAASAASAPSRTQTFDAASQVATSTYDSLGRLTNDGARSNTWDLASRLKQYTESGNTVVFTYDALRNRLSRSVGGATRSYVWNYALGLSSISVERQGNTDIRYYVHTPSGRLLYSIEASDPAGRDRRFYHYDEVGSTLFLTNNSGAVSTSYAYTPYGVPLASRGDVDNPFTYLGEYGVMREGTSGLYYMRARYYDSASTRFISRDPIRSISPRSINPYQYALGNPKRFIDPSGLQNLPRPDIEKFLRPGVSRGAAIDFFLCRAAGGGSFSRSELGGLGIPIPYDGVGSAPTETDPRCLPCSCNSSDLSEPEPAPLNEELFPNGEQPDPDDPYFDPANPSSPYFDAVPVAGSSVPRGPSDPYSQLDLLGRNLSELMEEEELEAWRGQYEQARSQREAPAAKMFTLPSVLSSFDPPPLPGDPRLKMTVDVEDEELVEAIEKGLERLRQRAKMPPRPFLTYLSPPLNAGSRYLVPLTR